VAARLKLWRNVGKEAVLGLGFGMGVDKFQQRLRDPKNPEVSKLVENGTLNIDFCGKIVKKYRTMYPEIPDFWYDLNRAFMWAKDGRIVKLGRLKLRKVGRQAVGIVLPSGRQLYYRHIRRERYTGKNEFTAVNGEKRDTRKGEWEWKHGSGQRIYGGLLAENVTQAVARDVLAETIRRAEQERGYEVVLHVHDEIVPRVPEGQGEEALAWAIQSLSTPPEWAPGLPLAAEGHVKRNLGK
jgi:DNA polymerase